MEIKYNCPRDCENQLIAGGKFDNPQPGGCYVDDKFPDDIPITLEEDNNLPLCPFYEKRKEQ
ncbi:hypothetical protein DA01_08795 [Dehalococcoides mccartyi]|uniref:Uncharacterized protein n=1 Tax=Dehalococcoides mccartyi TaxID=61435 RepID=A0A0V8LXB7_9CHLR|nr:hypothetical protein [Dehalococcoides mccartyi]KSV16175.1 hypothetical protein DA01_08795 [Dehalococcoides mccartyi]